MDMTGAMPESAWFEIRDVSGGLLASIPARIEGGSVTAEFPAFPGGTRGTIQLCTERGGEVHRDDAEVEELPVQPLLMGVQMG